MKWSKLHGRIGKQQLKCMRKTDVTIFLDGNHVGVELKFMSDGTPYLIPIKTNNERGNKK